MSSTPDWKLKDVLLVTTILFVAAILAYPLFDLFISNEDMRRQWFLFLWSLLNAFLPVFWVERRYNLKRDRLQIRKGRWSFKRTATIGVSTGIACFLFDSILMGPSLMVVIRFIVGNPLDVLLLPFSLLGGVLFLLSPIGEEVYFRGFIYGYLRTRLGTKFGLLVQALIFSFLHLDFFSTSFSYLLIQRALFGIVLGVLCVTSGSICPGIISHGVTNYLINLAHVAQLKGG